MNMAITELGLGWKVKKEKDPLKTKQMIDLGNVRPGRAGGHS